MRAWLLGLLGICLSVLVFFGIIYSQKVAPPTVTQSAASPLAALALNSATPSPAAALPGSSPTSLPSASSENTPSNQNPDLSVDSNGLSKATVIVTTTEGIIKFKFYSNDAPKTVKRLIELINKGFYNGLSFHRVVPGFVIQGGDPSGNGTGGSGQKLDAEFNNRRHVEGAVAMARASDPNSADSQFYISLGTFPHLDHSYTVFGQVIEGMDAVKKIKPGDKMTSVTIQ